MHQNSIKIKIRLLWQDFCALGLDIATNGGNIDRLANPTPNQERVFRSQFGVSWFICEDVWNMLDVNKPDPNREAKHLLWTFIFLKVYGNETTHARLVGTSPKTFRKWVWNTLTEIADLKAMVVSECWFEFVQKMIFSF